MFDISFVFRLEEDFDRCAEGLKNATSHDDQQFWLRMSFRSYFGFLEAWLFVMRQYFIPGLVDSRRESLKLDQDQELQSILFATENYDFRLTDQGRGELQDRRTSFLPMMRAVVRILYKVSGKDNSDIELKLSGKQWDSLKKSVKIRDRVTHPKSDECITIYRDAAKHLVDVHEWMADLLLTIDYAGMVNQHWDEVTDRHSYDMHYGPD